MFRVILFIEERWTNLNPAFICFMDFNLWKKNLKIYKNTKIQTIFNVKNIDKRMLC